MFDLTPEQIEKLQQMSKEKTRRRPQTVSNAKVARTIKGNQVTITVRVKARLDHESNAIDNLIQQLEALKRNQK